MNKSLLLSTVVAAASLSILPAAAADLVLSEATAPVVEYLSDPAGFCDAYIGVQAGYVFGETEYSGLMADSTPTFEDTYVSEGKNDGVLGGLYAGCNFLYEGFLWGLEGDFSLLGTGNYTHQDWLSTFRLRGGVKVNDDFLVYGTAGVAVGQIDMINGGKMQALLEGGMLNVETPVTFGYAIGAGLEYWVNDNVSLKTEYLFVDLGEVGSAAPNMPNAEKMLAADFTAHVLRAGVAFHF